jgi:putative transport protein
MVDWLLATLAAKSNIPELGYGMPYAVGHTVLTTFGMVIVLLFT